MKCQELCGRLDDELETAAYADVDASANGLQVGSGEREIEHVAFAVDAAVETIEEATDAGADLLVTHHGIAWDGIDRVTGPEYDRLEALFDGDCSLYVSHLPLDGNLRLGNAAGVADVLSVQDKEPFGDIGGESVGLLGRLPDPESVEYLADELRDELDTAEGQVRALDFGPEEVWDVAIVTGSGVDFLESAVDAGADILITGEGKQHAYHEAKEREINVILGGHYATETFGINSLEALVRDWDLETTVIDCPTGI